MVRLNVVYEDDLHTLVTHERSGQTLHTDAPTDHLGKGSTFSPTDLLAAALASCIATVLGIHAQKKGLDFRGLKIVIDKIMSTKPPRRIVRFPINIMIPVFIPVHERDDIIKAASNCPVQNSLNPEIDVSMAFQWMEE